jgi:hypothetical protein
MFPPGAAQSLNTLRSRSVDSRAIQPRTADELRQRIRPSLAFLGRLRQRMEHRGFPPDDELYCSVAKAYLAMQELHVRLHYQSCEHGVGKSAAEMTAGNVG